MKDFNKQGSFSGRGERGNFSRPSFGRPSFNNRGRNDKFGPPEMHDAICAKCGEKCQVPFRPNNKKPVFCKNCFDQTSGNTGGGDRFPKRDFNSRPFEKPRFEKPRYENTSAGNGSDQTTRHLEAISLKLERLIQAVQNLTVKNQVKTEIEPIAEPTAKNTTETPAKKTPKKKAVKK